LTGIPFLEGKTHEIPLKLYRDWSPTQLTYYFVSIPAQLVNFSLIPPLFRVLWANFIGSFWNIYISSIAKSNTKKEGVHQEYTKLLNDGNEQETKKVWIYNRIHSIHGDTADSNTIIHKVNKRKLEFS
jgi:hypothetical protein